MRRCATCQRLLLISGYVLGYRAGTDRYCSIGCFASNPRSSFCWECREATTSESPGNTFLLNAIGTRLCFSRDRCPKCHSIVQLKAFTILFVPIAPLGWYRVLHSPRGNFMSSRYVGRRL